MEGERILQELKMEDHLESLVERTTNYMSPLFHTEPPPCNKTLAKLEVFSLKLLKQCVERGKTSPATHHLNTLCHLAISCLQVCAGASGRVPPLSFEKLLLHFAQLCLSHGDFSSAIGACQQLRGRLSGKEEGGREEGREGDTLLKHAFDLVWKAALTVEQTGQDKTNAENPCRVAADQCLDLREEAFLCLLTARERNAVFAVDRIVKTSQHYLQLSAGKTRQCSMLAECYQRLDKFHASLLALCDLPSLLPPSHSFLCVDYLCLVAKVSSIAGHTHQAALYLAKAKEVCPGLRDSGSHLPSVHLPSTLLHMDQMDTENEKRLCGVLQLVCAELRLWCEAGQDDTERVARWREAQLLKKTSLLVDCLRHSGCHGDIMATLASTARVLLPLLLCEDGEDGEGGEVMVEMWVRGKKELDSGDLQQWKGRTLMSLLPPSHPPLSTKHRAHILNAEFTRYTDQGSANYIAAGKELIDVYREGGKRWDVERGKVMVAIATADSSLLDEALEVLGGVEGSSYHTPSHQHQALLHLASAHTLKAVAVLQDKMGSCDVGMGSHDPVSESCDQGSRAVDKCVSLSDEQRKALYDGEVEKHLVWGVEKWCQWGESEGEGEREEEGEKIFYFLHLTAELCLVTRQFNLALKSLEVILNIYQPTPSLTASYQTALATYCLLGVREGADICWGTIEKRLLGAVRGEVGGKGRGVRSTSHLVTSYLKCRLALATLYLHRGEADRGRAELVGLFRDPLLSRHTLSAHTLTAGTKITTAHLLQTRYTATQPLKQFLTQLLTDQSTQPECKAVCHVTSVELVSSAVKTLTSLAHHHGPRPEGGGREGLSSGPGSWDTLSQLLDGLLQLSSMYLRQAAVREALYYAREGAALARKVALAAWYTEFCLLLARIHRTKGDMEAAEAATLSLSPLPSPPSPSSWDKLHTALAEAEAELALNHPSKALTVCSDAINDSTSMWCDVDMDLALAGLHLVAGKAAVQEVALTRPVLMEELWGQARGRGRERGKTGSKRGVLSWLSLVPKPFQQALSHFCTSLQLCYPACPPPLLREVYQWLSVVLSPYHSLLATHCLLHSFHLSLGHQAATTLAKKIQKYSPQDCKHPFHNILVTLQDGSEVCSASSDPLVLARDVLRPPTSPPSLSVTSSLLSALPEGCQLTAICLFPSTSSSQGGQDHLLVCAVGKNREPLFVKTVIDGHTKLEEFSCLLAESEASMQLSEKRAWWGTRRRLDRRIKEVVNGIQSEWLGDCADVLVPPPSSSSPEATPYHLLCVGRRLQHLPWESIPVLQGQPVARTPSLTFSVAHQILQTTQRSSLVDPERGYFVLNPRGDLPATEKRFHGWFEEELGWTGVVGQAPTSNQFSEALEDHDVFVYCGHGTGREFLATDHFQLLGCQATTLLMGCGSGRLVVGGCCDPSGMALTYLLAGCPSLVAVLWDVTDGDIDRLSRALLEEWLEQREGERVLLGQALATARSVCKLEGLNGYAAVMYGDPSSAVVR